MTDLPKLLDRLAGDPDSENTGCVTQAMLQTKKIDIDSLQRASESG